MELLIFLGSLFFFMCFGVPLAVVLVLCSIVLMFHSGMWDAMIIPNTMLDGTNNYPLMAIPFFVFAGEIMAAGGLSKRVVALAEVMVGRIRGGLGYAAIVASIIFAGLMGSSVGEAAALGGEILVSKSLFSSNVISQARGDASGFVKVVWRNGEMAGIAAIGGCATQLTLSAELLLMGQYSGSRLNSFMVAHPTLDETLVDAVKAPRRPSEY